MSLVDTMKKLVAEHGKRVCSSHGCTSLSGNSLFCHKHYIRLKKKGVPVPRARRYRPSAGLQTIFEAVEFTGDDCFDWPHLVDAGYPLIGFLGKNRRVHVVVCEHVHGPKPSAKHEAAHECGNSKCCNPAHLSWKTHKENIADKRRHGTLLFGEKHHAALLTEEDVRKIRMERGQITRRKLADLYGVGKSTVDNIIDNVTWRHVQ